jgi:hypothetical protein
MKKILIGMSALIFLIYPISAFAINAPAVNDIPDYVDADVYLIKGTAEPFSKVSAVGGMYSLAPVTAKSNGYFEILVPLTQNTKNLFNLTAEMGSETSAAAKVEINENEEKAKDMSEDTIAPEKPTINEYETVVDAPMVTITGQGEAKAYIVANGEMGQIFNPIENDGNFSLELTLKQNNINKFKIFVQDESGNVSKSVDVEITEGDPSLRPEISGPFTDTIGHWAFDYIESLRLLGVVSGYGDGTFGPENPVTRAEITKIALTAFNYPITETVSTDPFSDVDHTLWYAAYIKAAKDEGVVAGYPEDGTFRPLSNVSRVEALKILLQAAKIEVGDSAINTFSDTELGLWYSPYISYAVENGIVSGYPGNLFKPTQAITRAEICKITVKVKELKEALQTIPTI